jgi:ATPase family associated with various cellular activities (AAA)
MAKNTETFTESRTVTLDAARREVEICARLKRPLFLWGPPGIGKSELVASICESMNGKLYDLRLALMDPSDLKGVLYYNPAVGNAMWNAPPDLPTKEEAAKYPVVFLFLDEMNSAAPATQAAAYQLVLNRRVGTYELPDNCVIIAAGNRDTDRGVTYRMPKPLANRFVHLQLRVDFESWQNWAIDNMIHPDVLAYVTCNKNDLFQFEPSSNSVSFATPRSWVFVSQLLTQELKDMELNDLVAGTVGEGVALKFAAHRKIASQMPNPSDILKGKIKELKNKDIGAKYSITISLCYELKASYDNRGGERMKEADNNEWHKEIDNVFRFLLDNLDTELQVMFVSTLMKNYRLPMKTSKTPNYKEFSQKNGNYIIEAVRGS